jgi:hypothetical protein
MKKQKKTKKQMMMMMMMMMGCEQIHYNYLQAAEFSLESESR